MKRLFIVMFLASNLSFAGGIVWNDSWAGKDKVQHTAISAAIGAATGMYFEDKTTAFAVAMIPGIAKEIYDYKHSNKHSASFKDLAADALGAAVGVYLGNCVIRARSFSCHYEF